jgi:hypothetical protein
VVNVALMQTAPQARRLNSSKNQSDVSRLDRGHPVVLKSILLK